MKKNSRDSKIKIISIEDFYNRCDYLCNISNENLWHESTIPEEDSIYYKLTSQYLICIIYTFTRTNFGLNAIGKLELILVAYRDGKTEYKLLNNRLDTLKEERLKHRSNKRLDKKILEMEQAINLLPAYCEKNHPLSKPFDSYLVYTGYKTSISNLKNKYLVFDVETNGLRKSTDDLLSLSIYDPTTGVCYNRYFPLDMQPLVLTGYINGITDEMLASETHMTQDELDWLLEYFDLKNKTLLSFSGGQGTFDFTFVQNYCKRHNIVGFEDLKIENIKNRIPKAPFGCEGQLTKDNLCRIFGISGVSEIHSSYNDCILEWKLFEKLESECVFFIDKHLFKYTPDYIIPYTYLFKHKELVKYAGIKIPAIQGKATEIFKLTFAKKIIKEIKKFPTNITGITIEHGINAYLKAEKQDNFKFLSENKSHLVYIGSLDSNIKEIPIIEENDGSISAINDEDKGFIDEVNIVTKKIIDCIKPLADYLKKNIFADGKIMTQELSISEDGKVLALCDLSDSKNVLEIKTFNVIKDNYLDSNIARQLYFQSKGRKTYVLSINFDTHFNEKTYKQIIDDLNIYLYKVELSIYQPEKMTFKIELDKDDARVFDIIINNPKISKSKIETSLGLSTWQINRSLNILENLEYIKKENPSNPKSPWIIMRKNDDRITNYYLDDGFTNDFMGLAVYSKKMKDRIHIIKDKE